jgi:hypothetical protein
MARTATPSKTRNPLAVDPDRESRVRERAYLLWESDGKPHGRDVEYWERARELISTENSTGSGPGQNAAPASALSPEAGGEEASVQDDPGNGPDRPADQGEAKATPPAKRKSRARAKKPA